MDSKLKALKVVDLKQILAQAAVSVPAKSNKQDLIARIIASKPALDVYNRLYPSNDDLLAPPEDVDWNVDDLSIEQISPIQPGAPPASTTSPAKPLPPTKATPVAKPQDAPAPTPAPTTASTNINTTTTTDVSEAEKRKQRAARFGIPLVEPHPAKKQKASNVSTNLPVDLDKLKVRAAKFMTGTPAVPRSGQKRPLSIEQITTEEAERRKKRAERFGIAHKPAV